MKKIIYVLCLLTASAWSVNPSLFAAADPVRVAERDIFDEEAVEKFPDLKKEWEGTKIKLQADSKSGDKYSGHLEIRGEKMSFSGTVKDGILRGEISLSNGKKRDFTLEPEGRNLIFQTGSFTDKLETMLKEMTIPLSDTVNLDMIWIKPGSFMMGSPTSELGRNDDETQHRVTLTQGYWMGKYEVTQAQYKAIMGTNPSRRTGDDLPVQCVTWDDAKAFCKNLTAIEKAAGRLPEGYAYTLPTEAQWEYACRAGTTTALNSGKNLTGAVICPNLGQLGWYLGVKENRELVRKGNVFRNDEYKTTYEYDPSGRSDGKTHPVGQKQPNAWGLYDMHGNVWEWCLDRCGDYPTSAVTDPTGPATGSNRVVRGGGWDHGAYRCRSAYRGGDNPVYNYTGSGFRVALAPVQ